MKIQNKSRRTYQHSELDGNGKIVIVDIKPNEIKDVSESIAQAWLKTGDVVEYADPKDQAKLQDENAKLKAELAALKGEAPKAEKSLEELKKEADALGIVYAKNIGAKKLAEKIEAAKG